MKLVYVILQVALVGAGILIYDQVRTSEAPPVFPDDPIDVARAAEPAPREVEVLPPIVLEGTGVEAMSDRLSALERKVAEARARRSTEVVPDSGYRPPVPSGVDGRDDRERDPETGHAHSTEDIEWFRSLKRGADQIERRERYVSMMNRQLNRLELSLTDSQRQSVIDTTISFREKVQQKMRDAQAKSLDRDARQAVLEQLRGEYESTVYSLIPATEAEKVVQSLGRYPGFGARGTSGRFGRR